MQKQSNASKAEVSKCKQMEPKASKCKQAIASDSKQKQAHASQKQAKANKCKQNHAHASKSEQMQAKPCKQFASNRKHNQTNWLAFACFCLHLLVFAWRFLAFDYLFMEISTT